MLRRYVCTGAIAVAAIALFSFGGNVDNGAVKAVTAVMPQADAGQCLKINADNYGYCCRLRLEAACSAPDPQSRPGRLDLAQAAGLGRDGTGNSGGPFGSGDADSTIGRSLGSVNNGGAPGADSSPGTANMGDDGEGRGGNNGDGYGNMGTGPSEGDP